MSPIRTITTEQLAQELQQGAVAEFWNVLTDDSYTGEMIPQSRRVPLDKIGRVVAATGVARTATVVTYCSGLACPQSRMAAEKLQTLGYTNVRAYEGGIEEWKAVGHDVESTGQPVAA